MWTSSFARQMWIVAFTPFSNHDFHHFRSCDKSFCNVHGLSLYLDDKSIFLFVELVLVSWLVTPQYWTAVPPDTADEC